MSDKAFLGSGGKPLGMEREEETRQKRHSSIETGTMSHPGWTTPVPQTAERQDPAQPCSHSQKNQGPHRQGHEGHTPTEPGAVPRSQVPAISDNRNATAWEHLFLNTKRLGAGFSCPEAQDTETKTLTRFYRERQGGGFAKGCFLPESQQFYVVVFQP